MNNETKAARTPTLHLPLRKEPALNHGDAPIGSRLFHVRDAYNNAICVKVEECEADTVVRACNSHGALVAALQDVRGVLRHAAHCRSNQPMVPPRGFNRYPCDCGVDHVRDVATAAIKAAKGEA